MRRKKIEQKTQRAILDWLRFNNILAVKISTVGIYKGRGQFIPTGAKGMPDILAIVEGKAVGIEVKSPTGKLTEHQEKMKEAWRQAGGIYIVAHNLDDIIPYFIHLKTTELKI